MYNIGPVDGTTFAEPRRRTAATRSHGAEHARLSRQQRIEFRKFGIRRTMGDRRARRVSDATCRLIGMRLEDRAGLEERDVGDAA